ncbi:hypothetical protein GLOIN_2v677430 [Rhizophagus irregularis DAOM 181602=DAOM 197198]|nr:hypothetical protein GLOIN_2v677430 [Rhizophagus irregularis DAOM 181602=DAOM 197198]
MPSPSEFLNHTTPQSRTLIYYLNCCKACHLIWHTNPDIWVRTSSVLIEQGELCSYLNFMLFTLNKIRILIQYFFVKIGLVISWISSTCLRCG